MEYVEDNGVSIKVDYVAFEDDNLYIAFNVLAEEEFDTIVFGEIEIENDRKETIYSKKYITEEDSILTIVKNKIAPNNMILIYELNDVKYTMNNLNIKINRVDFIEKDRGIIEKGEWEINI